MPSGDGDPPFLPFGKRPLRALFSDPDSSSDSDGVVSRFPGYCGQPHPDCTASASPPLSTANPENRDVSSSSESHPTNRPRDPSALDTRPTQRQLTDSREARSEAVEEIREGCRLVLRGRRPLSTSGNLFATLLEDGPMSESSLRARSLISDTALRDIPPHHTLARAEATRRRPVWRLV